MNQSSLRVRHFFDEYGSDSFLELSRRLNTPAAQPSAMVKMALDRLCREAGFDGPLPWTQPGDGSSLLQWGAVLAANHHGFDTTPEMVQATLIFGLQAILEGGEEPPPVIVLACSSVPLGNATGPGAFVFGRRGSKPRMGPCAAENRDVHGSSFGNRPQSTPALGRPLRLNFFPRSWDWRPVAGVSALTRPDLLLAQKRLRQLDLEAGERQVVGDLFEQYLLTENFLNLRDFKGQAAWFNQRLWADRFPPGQAHPKLCFLDLESLTSSLLALDLRQPDSAAAGLLLDPQMRPRLLNSLTGVQGCWSANLLEPGGAGQAGTRGTVMFWRRADNGCFQPLGLDRRGCLSGGGICLPWEAEPLAEGLSSGHLRPGLFLNYLALADHGLEAHGGVYMADYRPTFLTMAAKLSGRAFKWGAPLLAAGPLPVTVGNTVGGDKRLFPDDHLRLHRCLAEYTIATPCDKMRLPDRAKSPIRGPDAPYPAGAMELTGPRSSEFWIRLGRLTLAEARDTTFNWLTM